MEILLSIILGIIVFGSLLFYKKLNKKKLSKSVKYWQDLPLHNWEINFLSQKRKKTDPEADKTIKSILESGNVEEINAFYSTIHRNSDLNNVKLPSSISDYFRKNNELPSWADKSLIKEGERFYIDHGDTIALVLCAKSLPECYACANGAMVLYRTGRLSEKNGSLTFFTRRIAETAQFIVNAMSPGGLSPNGNGILTAKKVRLIHSSIRYYLSKDNWDSETYGEPINQEDMAGTLMSFAPLVIQGLETLGISVSETEKEAYFHCWRIIGHFMGIDEDLLPNNYQDALNLGNAIFDKEKAKSEQGQALTSSLIDFMTLMDDKGVINIIVIDLLRLLIGNETADLLGVPAVSQKSIETESEIIKSTLGNWENLIERSTILKLIVKPINKLLLNGMLKLMNNGEKITFFIPPSLQENWGLDNTIETNK